MVSPAQPASTLDLSRIASTVRQVCSQHPVARADLFGSRARGQAHPGSDVDLLVEFLPSANPGLFALGLLREDLADALGCPVDVVSRHALERSANPFRRRAILDSSVPIYAR